MQVPTALKVSTLPDMVQIDEVVEANVTANPDEVVADKVMVPPIPPVPGGAKLIACTLAGAITTNKVAGAATGTVLSLATTKCVLRVKARVGA